MREFAARTTGYFLTPAIPRVILPKVIRGKRVMRKFLDEIQRVSVAWNKNLTRDTRAALIDKRVAWRIERIVKRVYT